MSAEHVKVVYILGHAFSGSTLFSLALGNSPGLVNLGGVSFLENDYVDQKYCLCGQRLAECSFWQKIQTTLDEKQRCVPFEMHFQLNNDGILSGPDKRHKSILTRLKLIVEGDKAYPEQELNNYALKNERFFHVVSEVTGGKLCIDVAKSPYRLSILLQRTDIDFKVIWFQRNMKGLFASRIRRDKIRNRFYLPFFTPVVSILWLVNYHRACSRLFDILPDDQKCTIHYEDFVQDPDGVQENLAEFLGTALDFKVGEKKLMKINDQHIYVGNRWLFKEIGLKEVQIQSGDSGENAGRIEAFLYWALSYVFPVLNN